MTEFAFELSFRMKGDHLQLALSGNHVKRTKSRTSVRHHLVGSVESHHIDNILAGKYWTVNTDTPPYKIVNLK